MRTSKILHVVSCHAGGEVGDVIVAGAPRVPGATILEQSRFIASDQALRRFVLNEPRGGVFRHVNLLVPPKSPDAQFGWIIMEPEDTPPMSGSNAMCVATVLLETGIVPIQEPETRLTLEAPGGLVEIRATCSAEKVDRITVVNVPSFADSLDANLEVEGVGTLSVDTAYGGDSFVLVGARGLGFSLSQDEASDLAKMGAWIVAAANQQLAFDPLRRTPLSNISFCQFTAPVESAATHVAGLSAVVVRPGKIDRSPCGTGCSARMSVLHARGQLRPGEVFIGRSILGSEFVCKIEREVRLGGRPAIIPSISGKAWITGLHQYMLDPTDPWPEGYRLSDTWPTSPLSH